MSQEDAGYLESKLLQIKRHDVLLELVLEAQEGFENAFPRRHVCYSVEPWRMLLGFLHQQVIEHAALTFDISIRAPGFIFPDVRTKFQAHCRLKCLTKFSEREHCIDANHLPFHKCRLGKMLTGNIGFVCNCCTSLSKSGIISVF